MVRRWVGEDRIFFEEGSSSTSVSLIRAFFARVEDENYVRFPNLL